jgi:hypothetical protein
MDPVATAGRGYAQYRPEHEGVIEVTSTEVRSGTPVSVKISLKDLAVVDQLLKALGDSFADEINSVAVWGGENSTKTVADVMSAVGNELNSRPAAAVSAEISLRADKSAER